MRMKGFAMLGIGKTGWIEKEVPTCGPLDAIVRPLAVSPCTSDIHTVWEGAIGERTDMILGHEAVGEIVKVGNTSRKMVFEARKVVAARPDISPSAADVLKEPVVVCRASGTCVVKKEDQRIPESR